MSRVVIQGDASGTGNFTIAAPNSDTNRTLTLPDEAGTVLTTAGVPSSAMPAGSVLQMVNLVYSTQSSMTIGTTDTDVTGMSLSITPVKSGSKFRIDIRLFGEMAQSYNTMFNIHRGTTRINTTSNLNYHGLSTMLVTYGGAEDNDSTPEILNLFTIDSTGSTAGTPITYKLVASSNANRTLWINRCFGSPTVGYETGISEIIITEIGT